MQGLILYEGASYLGDQQIAVIATFKSGNGKTGPMVQIWILVRDISPTEASATGADVSCCGDCKLRHFKKGPCYVVIFQGPGSVWGAYDRGSYRHATDQDWRMLQTMRNRIGAYGDPAAAPPWITVDLGQGPGSVGYTHQWRTCDPIFANFLMASVDSIEEMHEAHRLGWRTFRTGFDGPIPGLEVRCPHKTKGTLCYSCGLCSGNQIGAKSIYEELHGARSIKLKKQHDARRSLRVLTSENEATL